MLLALGLLTLPISLLMALKLARSVQEWRSSRAGYITFGGDDRYQARNVERSVHDACMVARVRLDMSAEAFEEVVARVQANYPAWVRAVEASIEHRPPAFEPPLEIRERYEPPRLGDTPLLAKIILCREDRTVVLMGNHVYLGGYLLSQFVQLVFCGQVSKGVFPRNRYFPVLTEGMILALFARLLTRPARVPPRLFEEPSRLRRLYWKQSLAEIEATAAELRMNRLYVIIARHIAAVMEHMGRDRLRVTLPISFEAEDSFNTVGAIFLDVEAAPDFPSLARRIRNLVQHKRWQVSASNHVQRIFPTRELSQRARNTVDFTLTTVPQKTLPENLLAEELVDYEFTMDNIDYAVYAMAFEFEGFVHTSLMINSPDFDVAGFQAAAGARSMDLGIELGSRSRDEGVSEARRQAEAG
ncbi:MAG: hypothetical protein H6712_24465 [Myxococcales bacterium]|nr:hypothetical protein [Myxococcales bacterium]MCB9717033.1 hypothetical protein [Myxococcales bacterium]